MKPILIKNFIMALFCIFFQNIQCQQSISGSFPTLAHQAVKLTGYDGFNTYTIDSVKADEKGQFKLLYSKKDYGMAYLTTADNKPFLLIINGEDILINGESFAQPETIKISKSIENNIFAQYASAHPRREQALSAWDYLEKIYALDTLFSVQNVTKQAILKEKQRIKAEDSLFLANISSQLFASWYLPLRKLVSSVSIVAQYRTHEIPATIAAFREIDYTDSRLYKSGLLSDVLESHFWLIENSGRSLDSVFSEMNKSIDCMVANLKADQKKLNEITAYLFKLLEKRSLFNASEYLALKLLNEQGCTINSDFAAQLENYRAMKKGNTAPDFTFDGDVIWKTNGTVATPKKLSDIKNKYTLIIFGASWCPACPQELLSISQAYAKWKKYGVEVIFVSLDEYKLLFTNFAGEFPFISFCDYKKWDSPVVKAYHVFATPTLYLLDDNRQILLRPNNVAQMDAWVGWYRVQGNK